MPCALNSRRALNGARLDRIGNRDVPGVLSVDGNVHLGCARHSPCQNRGPAASPENTELCHEPPIPCRHSPALDDAADAFARYILKTGHVREP